MLARGFGFFMWRLTLACSVLLLSAEYSSNVRGLARNLSDLAVALSEYDILLCSETLVSDMSHRSFNYDTDNRREWIMLGDRHWGLETFLPGSRSKPMQSSITACSTGQSANHLHHRGDKWSSSSRTELAIHFQPRWPTTSECFSYPYTVS